MSIAADHLLEVQDLVVEYGRGAGLLRAVDHASFSLRRGETLAIIGESGSGKSSLAHAIAGLVPVSDGSVRFLRSAKPSVTAPATQVIFQDPSLALNSRLEVWKCVAEPLAPRRLRLPLSLRAIAVDLLRRVGLDAGVADRRPAQLSGGQRQRVTIARALASKAPLILCDEPVASLDASLQADVLKLLRDLQEEHQLTYLFISHDLSSVARIAHRTAVMYMGRVVEVGPVDDVLSRPRHPYAQALLAATPSVSITRRQRPGNLLRGEMPNPRQPPSGCRFRTRCPFAQDRCADETPVLEDVNNLAGHAVACHFWRQIGPVNPQPPTRGGSTAPTTHK